MGQPSGGRAQQSGSAGRTAARSAEGRPAETHSPGAHDAFCPHCRLLVVERAQPGWPRRAVRCPHCRLLIGAGRGRQTAGEDGTRGAAAGVFARAAADSDEVLASADEIRKAIREVAAELGTSPERLLMVEYQQHGAARDNDLPSLGAVFATYGTWKQARREASQTG